VTGGWRKLHNDELRNLYSSPNIIRMIMCRRMRGVGYLAHIEEGCKQDIGARAHKEGGDQ
jgi:hypothetical protein